MPALVQLESDQGVVLFEGDFNEADLQEIALQDKVEDIVRATGATLSAVSTTIRRCASELLGAFDDLATTRSSGGSFSQATIELGIGVSGEGNVIVAKGAAEANLKVTLTWDFG